MPKFAARSQNLMSYMGNPSVTVFMNYMHSALDLRRGEGRKSRRLNKKRRLKHEGNTKRIEEHERYEKRKKKNNEERLDGI